MTDAFPSLIAFRFLAFALGEQIYDPRPNGLREAIKAGEPQSPWHVTEGGIERKFRSFHAHSTLRPRPD